MKLPCDCCEGPHVLTPLPTDNRPGLSALRYRVGTHATFFGTMQARLSGKDLPELAALKMRERSDASIAMLDAWSTVGDVLTFYQERIANEGYLRTATERRSILEQARLVGYKLRPGVASSVYLAYTVEKDSPPVEIPKGARVNSIPEPGEQMQAFETSEPFLARHEWNTLSLRMMQPQTPPAIVQNGLYLKGTATNLKPNDALIIDWGTGESNLMPLRVHEVLPDNKVDRTWVTLRNWDGSELSSSIKADEELPARKKAQGEKKGAPALNMDFLNNLTAPPSLPPSNAKQLERSVAKTFAPQSGVFPKLLATLSQRLNSVLYPALRNAEVAKSQTVKVYALRKTASLFGHNAPKEPQYEPRLIPIRESYGELKHEEPQPRLEPNPKGGNLKPQSEWCEWTLADDEAKNIAYLDTVQDQLLVGSYVVIQQPTSSGSSAVVKKIDSAVAVSRAAYGLTGKTSKVTFDDKWWDANRTDVKDTPPQVKDDAPCPAPDDFEKVRTTTIYLQSEEMELGQEPVTSDIFDDEIELDALYDGLEPGRWIIVSGERKDIPGTTGVKGSELMMLAGITQKTRTPLQAEPEAGGDDKAAQQPGGEPLPEEKLHTFIKFSKKLAYRYQRETVTIYGNVVKATHGETRREVLGSGDAAKSFQTFQLKQRPLTYTSAPTVSGIESTLQVYVNDLKWHEAPDLAALSERDRKFTTYQDDDDNTSITYGDGEHGARLPSGQENIKAIYRSGIGKPGNAKAGQISLLATRPLGVKGVTNPIAASGGADKEGRDQARKNVPLALMALDRLVSTSDYADFTRTFAGIGKASARRLSDGRSQVVQVVIAGAEDIPVDETSDLYRNVVDALQRYGDAHVPVQLKIRERLALVISAKIRIQPDYLWEVLEPGIRAAVLDAFGFENVELGQDLLLAQAVRVIQNIEGVVYVDIEVFDKISDSELLQGFTSSSAASLDLKQRLVIHDDQLAYLVPEVPDTLILQEIKP